MQIFDFNDERAGKCFSFVDGNKEWCIIANTDCGPNGESAVSLGRYVCKPKFMIKEQGWFDYPLPENVSIHSDIVLTTEQAKDLIEYLQYFVDNGALPNTVLKEE